ncbi:protein DETOXIFICATION 27-like isoform X1 [Gossypium raimondii]|uniref:protein DETOXIFICATION 27-like isoform X1 n=1 Tax=Gossypium raimondii TaxID=29730 RepID=UPI00227C927B|nr:protein DETOXIFICATION 27-like isoform X1 [Gossypium raimondii]
MDSIHGNSGEYHQPLLTEPGSNHEESKPEENKWRDEDGEEGLKYKAMDRNKEAMGHRRTFNHQSCNSCCFYSMNIITQAFAGHLGMASALETLCGQAFGAKQYHMFGLYMQRSWIVLLLCCYPFTYLLPRF